jgi:phage terminase large subunit-like protein
VLYVSGTEDLAIGQLRAIKGVLECDIHRRYWPELIHAEEAQRAKWAERDIIVDHPKRKALGVRDSTIAARGITSNTTGLHCTVLVLDDIVIPKNAYTADGRQSVKDGYGLFSSVLEPGGITKIAGTRYHGQDIYGELIDAEYDVIDDDGNATGQKKLFEVFERIVEEDGVFLWPREQHPASKKWYGFDAKELAKIRAKYYAAGNRAQYHAQYYNNPNDIGSQRVDSKKFQYLEPKHLTCRQGEWFYADKSLAIFCGGDLAYTTGEKSDFTAFAIIGMDSDSFVYILELDQFKTNKYEEYYSAVRRLHAKWGFKRIKIETNAGANLVVEHIKTAFRKDGAVVLVEGANSVSEKIERTAAILEPRYETGAVIHSRGGFMSVYEEQVTQARSKHDDLKDAVSIGVEIAKPPTARRRQQDTNVVAITANARFGGRSR